MGVIKRGILGGFSGKVGNIVGSSWKSRAVIKSLPLSVANPRTTPQVNQRTKFGGISQFASVILSLWIKPLWDRFAGDISGYNDFCRTNIVGVDTSGNFTYADMTMSRGKMEAVSVLTAVADDSLNTIAGNVTFPTDTTWGQNGESCYIMACDQTQQIMLGVAVVTGNPSGVVAYSIPSVDFIAGDEINVFAVMKRADGTQVSTASLFTIAAIA